MDYVARAPGRHVHFGVAQSDEVALRRIVAEDLAGQLDVVVDDASHAYEHTKKSFEILFPLLSPGGLYVIEDWAWAHQPAYQGDGAPFAYRPSVTTLLYEQIALLGSTPDISEIRVLKPLYIMRKSPIGRVGHRDVWDGILMRGRKLHPI